MSQISPWMSFPLKTNMGIVRRAMTVIHAARRVETCLTAKKLRQTMKMPARAPGKRIQKGSISLKMCDESDKNQSCSRG